MASSRTLPASYNTKTYGNVTRDYQVGELSTWESDTDIDLVTATKGEVLDCYDDAASFDESGITFAGATANASYFRVVRAPSGQRHDGTPNNGFTLATTTNATILTASESFFQLQDLIIIAALNSANNRFGLNLEATSSKAIGLILKMTNAGTGEGRGIALDGTSISCINCLVYESKTFAFQSWVGGGETVYILNCTAINSTLGFDILGASGGTVVVTNCLGQDNSGGDFSGGGTLTETVTYCLSKDATADNWGGAGNLISKDLTFANEAGDDWHLAAADTDAINAGADLSATFDDDIDFTTRVSWDIGFDEYVAAAGGLSIPVAMSNYRFRRN